MFPLVGNKLPSSSNELAEAIRAGLSEFLTLPATAESVRIVGELPSFQSIQVTLDGAAIREQTPIRKFAADGSSQPGFTVETVEVSARPILYQQAKLNLKMSAGRSTFEMVRDADGRPLLILTDAQSGTVAADISDDDIEALAMAAAKTWSKEYGIAVQDVHVVLVSDGPRSISVEARIKAKKMMMTGVIILRGRVDISDALIAAVSNLSCTGEGMVGSTAAAIVQKRIQPFDGTQIPLTRLALGDVRLRDVRVVIDDSLKLSASFGS